MKICSLLPSGTEILFALRLGDRVVGVTDLCDYPLEARSKPIVSRSLIDTSTLSSLEVEEKMQEFIRTGKSPFVLDTERLRQLKPDLILTQDLCYICDLDAHQVFEALGLFQPKSQVLVLSPRTLNEIFADIQMVGEAAGAGARATEMISCFRERIRGLESTVARAVHKPRVFSMEGTNPLVAGGHWLPEMKGLAGGEDGLFSPGCPAIRLTWEQVLAYAPEVLVIAPCSSGLDRTLKDVPWLARQEGWWELQAVRSRQVYLVDHVYFSRPGPRIVGGLEILAQILHPELFTGLIPPGTVLKLEPLPADGCPPEEIANHFRPYP